MTTPDFSNLRITTNRLILREVVAEDWLTTFNYQSKSQHFRYYPWQQRTKRDVKKFIKLLLHWREEKPRLKFQIGVTLAETGQLIGLCGVRKITRQSLEAEIGYELDSAYWGCGYATEAAQAMMAFGFEQLKLHRIFATCLLKNQPSIQVMQRLGMQQEGRLRENQWMKGRWWDSVIYAILEPEWRSHTAGEAK